MEETPTRKPFTMGATQKLMSDAIKGNKDSTIEIRRRKETGEECFVVPVEGVVDVTNEQSESDTLSDDITLASVQRKKDEQGKIRANQNLGNPLSKRVVLQQRENAKSQKRKGEGDIHMGKRSFP